MKNFFTLLGLSLMLLCSPDWAATQSSVNAFVEAPSNENLLTPDQAFNYQLEIQDARQFTLHFKVAPGYYLYRERISIKADNTPLQPLQFPAGEIKQDPNFGQMEVYHHDFSLRFELPAGLQQAQQLQLSYQGCSEKGVCYAPIRKTETLQGSAPSAAASNPANYPVSLLQSGQFWLIISGFFGLGLLLSLTPCVLPMIPILSGIIVGDKKLHHHTTSRLHAFNLSLAYTLGMALSYTLAGVAAAFSGQLLSQSLQSPLVLSITALFLVLLSLSTFGLYEIKLPNWLQNRLVASANRFKGGQLISVFVMGALSALIVSPCVAAPLAGVLLYISQTHDVWLGATALFSLSMGMGVPLLAIGASARHVLPKAGAWMNLVKHLFGLLLLAVAIVLLSPILPVPISLALWGVLFAIPAVYFFMQKRSVRDLMHYLQRGIALLMAGLSLMYLIGAVTGAQSVLHPLQKLLGTTQQPTLAWHQVHSVQQLQAAIGASKQEFVMLDFYADWCVACKEMEKYTFADSQVSQQLKQFHLVQADVTANSNDEVKLLQNFKLFGPPAILFFDRQGHEIANARVIGFMDAKTFSNHLQKILQTKDTECAIKLTC